MLFLAWHSARMEWTLACPGEGGFWGCHLTCRFFLTWWRRVPSAPGSLCCLGCGPQFLLSPFLALCWCSPYLCCRPVCLCTAKRLSVTPKLISSSRRALTVLALAWPLAISRLPVLVILPSSRATPFPSDLTSDSTSPKTPLNSRSG